jgi:hypothetical protein
MAAARLSVGKSVCSEAHLAALVQVEGYALNSDAPAFVRELFGLKNNM